MVESSVPLSYSISSACTWRWAAVELFKIDSDARHTRETDVWSFEMVLR